MADQTVSTDTTPNVSEPSEAELIESIVGLMDDDGGVDAASEEKANPEGGRDPGIDRGDDGRFVAREAEAEPEGDAEESDVEAKGEDEAPEENPDEPTAESDEEAGIETFAQLAEDFGVDEDVLTTTLRTEINGEDVSLKELVDSYTASPLTEEVRREASEERDQYRAKLAEVHQREDAGFRELADTTQRMISMLEEKGRTEAEWAELREDDPLNYAIERDAWREKQELVGQSLHQLREADTRRAGEEQEKWQELVSQETQNVFNARPEWWDAKNNKPSDEGIAAAELIEGYLTKLGYSGEEQNVMIDHRSILMAHAAARGEKLQSGIKLAKKRVKDAPTKVLRKGGASDADGASGDNRQREALRRRLASSGDEDVAAKLMEEFV